MRLRPLTPESARIWREAAHAADLHPWSRRPLAYLPTRRGRDRRHAVACTIAAAIEELALAMAAEERVEAGKAAFLARDLPAFSGDRPLCVKCALAEGAARTWRREASEEYLVRKCKACGYPWEEQCADAATEVLEESALVGAAKDAARLAGVVPGA